MSNDDGVVVHNSGGGTLNLHGTVVGGNGNQVSVSQTASTAPGAAELLRVLTAIRLTATASTDLPAPLQARVVAGAADAQRSLAAGDAGYAGAVLLRTRAELEPVGSAGSRATAALCTLLDSALDLLPGEG